MSTVHERIQEEVSEIAGVLAREQGRTEYEVRQDALSLHRVRYETVVLLAPEPEKPKGRGSRSRPSAWRTE